MKHRKIGLSIACGLTLTGLGYSQQYPNSFPVYPSFQPVLPTTLEANPVVGPRLHPDSGIHPNSGIGIPKLSGPELLPVTTISATPGFNYVVPASNQPKEIPKTIAPAPTEPSAVPKPPVVPSVPVVPGVPQGASNPVPLAPGSMNPPQTWSTVSPNFVAVPSNGSIQAIPNTFIPQNAPVVQPSPMTAVPTVANPLGQGETGFQSTYSSGLIGHAPIKHWGHCGLGLGLLSHLFCQDPCPRPLPCVWGSAEFLNWTVRGTAIPALVISGPPGVLAPINSPLARQEYGGNILGGVQSGVRARLGAWLDSNEGFGLDLGFIWLTDSTDNYVSNLNSVRSLSRPIFNTVTNTNQLAVIDFEPIINGQIGIASRSSFWGGEANARQVFINTGGFRLDGYLGYRYLNLTDEMEINQIQVNGVGVVDASLFDRFQSVNQFHGGQLGLISEWNLGRLTIGLRGGAAVGFTFQRSTIEGLTRVETRTNPGGILARSSNIGETTRNRFSVVPHVGGIVGFDLNRYLSVFGGYDLLIWSNPTRVGGMIDPSLNPSILPGSGPLVGAPRPTNPNATSTYWLHGWSAGLQFKW